MSNFLKSKQKMKNKIKKKNKIIVALTQVYTCPFYLVHKVIGFLSFLLILSICLSLPTSLLSLIHAPIPI